MEIAFLLILLFVLVILVPIAALTKASAANRRLDELTARLDPLEQEINSLRKAVDLHLRKFEPPKNSEVKTETPTTKVVPPVQILRKQPESKVATPKSRTLTFPSGVPRL